MLKELTIVNFRNIDREHVELASHVNAMIGQNGQGKTNFLEAVYYLALLRSFRTSKINDLKQWKRDFFHLECRCSQGASLPDLKCAVTYGVDRRMSLDGNPVYRSSDYVNRFICITFIPQDKELVRGTDALRRRFLDISLSQLSPMYLKNLQQYLEALKSRNAMLKERGRYSQSMITAYDQVMVERGVAVELARRDFAEKLNVSLQEKAGVLMEKGRALTIKYLSGIGTLLQTADGDEETLRKFYHESLERHYERDCRDGFTHCGPHRSEMTCLLDQMMLARFGSEGECRIASLALKFASMELLKNAAGEKGMTLLVDDVVGELDDDRQSHFYSELLKAGQIILAGTMLPAALAPEARMFRVEGGRFIR